MWLIIAIMAAVLWGLNYSLDERIFKNQVSPLTILALQAWAGAIIFSVLSYFSTAKTDFTILSTNRNTLWLTLGSIAAANIGIYLIAVSIQIKNATFASLIEQTYPIFTILFTYLLFHENHLTKNIMIGGLFILIGTVIIALD
jgi:drug/metabolite transporter (DMT)-like permease